MTWEIRLQLQPPDLIGPYLDSRPMLPAGEYEAIISAMGSHRYKKPWGPTSLTIKCQGHEYHVLPQDTKEFK